MTLPIPTWLSLVEVADAEFQNLQELASIRATSDWASNEGSNPTSRSPKRTLLGRYDFLLVFEAPDRDSVFQLSLAAGATVSNWTR